MQLDQILGLAARAIQAVVESASSLVAMHWEYLPMKAIEQATKKRQNGCMELQLSYGFYCII
jgi:hypothetical protein